MTRSVVQLCPWASFLYVDSPFQRDCLRTIMFLVFIITVLWFDCIFIFKVLIFFYSIVFCNLGYTGINIQYFGKAIDDQTHPIFTMDVFANKRPWSQLIYCVENRKPYSRVTAFMDRTYRVWPFYPFVTRLL